ncbi:DUF3305 domain-containing protein [Guyparkeria sp.]|uniref:DUF3305 domain-containing protein n=1 Tax=Chromatiales TaxID=135613 RepID=UPI00397091CD
MNQTKPDPIVAGGNESDLPRSFRVSVVMERRERPDARWIRESWHLTGVTLDQGAGESDAGRRVIRKGDQGEQYLWPGFEVRLYRDELESYYHNLLAREPKIFVVTHTDQQGRPEPFLVSMSYDEANAYEFGGEVVYNAAIPPVLYAWLEQYLLENYAPERRIKRKRDCPGGDGTCQ